MGEVEVPLQSGLEPMLLPSKHELGRALLNVGYADWLFFYLFIFRYARFVVHTITGIFLYKPSATSSTPKYTAQDTAIIVPTVDPTTKEFYICLESILENSPRLLVIVTVGNLAGLVEDHLRIENTRHRYPATTICTLQSAVPNKRKQILLGLESVELYRKQRTDIPIIVFVDDQVSWGPRFLSSLNAAFEDPKVGLVGTSKKVIRQKGRSFVENYTNFLACLYLCRHNFQIRSEPYVDGALFVVSGRTCAVRSELVQDPAFRSGYQNELYCFGLRGPLNADDDNYITRFALSSGWKIKIQYTPDCQIVTPLGMYPKFYKQLLRWGRTTWRSNVSSLRHWHIWHSHPWSVYAVYISGLINFALIWDPLLVWALRRTSFYRNAQAGSPVGSQAFLTALMISWILLSKLVKIAPHLWDHPVDWILLPGYLVFAYVHSFIKLYCALTFWDHSWSGRSLESIKDRSWSGSTSQEREAILHE